MASESTTKPFVVDRGTSGGKNYYNIDVTTLANGGAERELYRTDSSGNNKGSSCLNIKVQEGIGDTIT